MLKFYFSQFESAVCRVCLCTDSEAPNMLPIYDAAVTASKVISFADMINQISNIQAIDGDELPAHICVSCKETLINSYKFKQQVEESDNVLRNQKNLKPKINFQNLDDLKLKIEDKSIIETFRPPETFQNFSSIVRKGGAIGNTVIQKVKKESFSDFEMDEDYLDDDDYVPDSPPRKKKKSSKRSLLKKSKKNSSRKSEIKSPPKTKTKKKTYNVIATIKGLDTFLSAPENANYCTLRKPIPVKMSDEMKAEKSQKPRQKRNITDNLTMIPLGGGLPFRLPERSVYTRRPRQSGPREKVKHVCPICGVQTYGLRTHLLTHVEHKPFKCEHCNKTFAQRGNYRLHLKKHTGIKDQVCEICGASFYLPRSVKRHRMIHTKDRNFACHLCPKRFYVKCDLMRHLRVHSGYKPFKCETCSMMFNAKHQLESHVRMHTGEKPFTCEICNVAFTYKVNLNNHVFKIHGVNLKFKSIYKITPDVLNELFQQEAENIEHKKNYPLADMRHS